MLPYPHLNFLDTSRSHSSDEASTFAMRDGNRRLGTYASTSQDSNSQWFLPRHLSFYTPEFSSLSRQQLWYGSYMARESSDKRQKTE